MGAVASTVGSLFSGPKKVDVAPAPNVPKSVTDASKKYEQQFAQQQEGAIARQNAANSPAVIAQLSQRALGQGPSLAEAQLKSATNRSLAQQLAMAASMRGRNPAAAQRQILNAQGDAGRQLAEASAVARLQEQAQAAQQLAQQQALSDQLAMSSGQQGFQTATLPGQLKYQGSLAQMQAQNAANAANAQAQNSLTSSLLGAGAQLGAAYLTGGASLAAGSQLGTMFGGAGQGGVNAQHLTNQAFASGGRVPGTPAVNEDSLENDKVPAMLSPGEIVIPRSHAMSLDKAKSFIQTLMEKEQSAKPRTKQSDMPMKRKSLASTLLKKD